MNDIDKLIQDVRDTKKKKKYASVMIEDDIAAEFKTLAKKLGATQSRLVQKMCEIINASLDDIGEK